MKTDIPRTYCIRCGECCVSSSPTLQMEDIRLIRDFQIHKYYLYTIRRGELGHDNIHNELKISETEFIKVREKDGGEGCIYYDEKGRASKIYDHKPVQCSVLACWDDHEFMHANKGSKLSRKEILTDHILLSLIEQHEKNAVTMRLKIW